MESKFINIHTHKPTGNHIEIETMGVHPWDAEKVAVFDIDTIPSTVQAIGETGLDYYCGVERLQQLKIFREQLSIAEQRELPVIIHCVKSFEDVMIELRRYSLKAVIFHGFMGSKEQMLEATKRGYYISFGARIFSTEKKIDILRSTPDRFLFLETDNSDVTIDQIYNKSSDIKSITLLNLKLIINSNYARIFK